MDFKVVDLSDLRRFAVNTPQVLIDAIESLRAQLAAKQTRIETLEFDVKIAYETVASKESEIQALADRCARMREDSERMDFLENQLSWAACQRMGSEYVPYPKGKARAAIDRHRASARAAEGAEGGGE